MSDKCYPVSIGEGAKVERYSEAYQTARQNAAKWKAVLQKAHGKDLVRCLCPGSGDRLLAVRYRSEKDSYHLSRYPRTGAEHAVNCQYYAEAPEQSGLGAYSVGVVEETDDGKLRVKLTLSLRKKEPVDVQLVDVEAPTTAKSSTSKTSKPAMTLGGLLHLLWTEARLNQWDPDTGNRWIGPVHARLLRAAKRVVVSRMRIGDALIVAGTRGDQETANRGKVESAAKNKRRLIAIGQLAEHSADIEEAMSRCIKIESGWGLPYLNITPDLWDQTVQSYPLAVLAWRKKCPVVAIMQTDQPEKDSKGRYKTQVLNIALMIVSQAWVPVESGYEWKIEKQLREQRRAFVKPMRFDAGKELVFPDFWLTDAGNGRHVPMEVYGRNDQDYLDRKAEKATYYDDQYTPTGWWYWDAYSDPRGKAIPPFPLAKAPSV